jgi:serine/threonine protein kinase
MIRKAGDVFHQFRLLEKIGEGGMGEVFRARDTRLDRDVALKFLTRVGPLSSAHGDMLRREAKSLAALNHPNIVTIYDIGETDGVPFLVLEWILGHPLNDPAHRKPFDEVTFLQIAVPIADALAVAHARGIIHRDVKPGNVLVAADGRVKLLDFGLAILREPDSEATRSHSGALAGTLAYMSPEQASGTEVGPPSDIFSFGVMAYELLCGQRPFEAASALTLLNKIVHEPHTPLASMRRGLTGGLVDVIERCLSKTPAARFQDAGELAQQLHRATNSSVPVRNGEVTDIQSGGRTSSRTRSNQDIRFCSTADDVGIAYSVIGSGPLLVRVLGHFTHLEMEWEWPALRLLWERLARRHTVVRYDGRGTGLSDHWPEAFTEETRQLDLEAVLNAVNAEKADLLGISEGGWTSAVYANARPDRISHLVLYGAYSRGARARPGYDKDEDAALITLIRKGWARDTPVFRQIFTSQFFRSNADPGLIAHFNEMQRVSADPETAARYHESCHSRGDGREIFERIRVPSLVIHCRDDQAVSFEEGRRLAALITGAQFVPLPSGTHYFPTDEVVTEKVVDTIDRFTGATSEPVA